MPSPKKRSSGRVTAKKPMRHDHPLCMDPVSAQRVIDLRRRKVELATRIAKGEPDLSIELEVLNLDLEEAIQSVRDNTVVFVALSIGKTRWTELKAQYKPTPEQKKEAAKTNMTFQWDVDLFPEAAFEECLRISERDEDDKEIGLTPLDEETLAEMFHEKDDPKWNDAELGELLTAILIANESSPRVGDLGNG